MALREIEKTKNGYHFFFDRGIQATAEFEPNYRFYYKGETMPEDLVTVLKYTYIGKMFMTLIENHNTIPTLLKNYIDSIIESNYLTNKAKIFAIDGVCSENVNIGRAYKFDLPTFEELVIGITYYNNISFYWVKEEGKFFEWVTQQSIKDKTCNLPLEVQNYIWKYKSWRYELRHADSRQELLQLCARAKRIITQSKDYKYNELIDTPENTFFTRQTQRNYDFEDKNYTIFIPISKQDVEKIWGSAFCDLFHSTDNRCTRLLAIRNKRTNAVVARISFDDKYPKESFCVEYTSFFVKRKLRKFVETYKSKL